MALSEEAKLSIILAARNMTGTAINQVSGALQGLQSVATGVMRMLPAVLAGAAAKNMIDATAKVAGEVARLSRSLGIAAEDASLLREAADSLGLGVDELARNMGAFSDHLTTLKDPGNIFKKLRIQVTGSNGELKSSVELLGDVADKIKTMPDGLAKLTVVRDLFGRGGEGMLKFLNKGRAGIAEYGESARKMGLMFDGQKLAMVTAYRDAMNDFSSAMTGLQVVIGGNALPVLSDLAKWFTEQARSAIPLLSRAVEYLKPLFKGLWSVITDIGGVIGRVVNGFMGSAAGGQVLARVSKVLVESFRWLLNVFKEFSQWLNKIKPDAEVVGRFLGAVAGVIMGEFKLAWDALEGSLRIIGDLLRGDFEKAWKDTKELFQTLKQDVDNLSNSLNGLPAWAQALAGFVGTAVVIKGIKDLWTALSSLGRLLGTGGLLAWLGRAAMALLGFIPVWGWIAAGVVALALVIYNNWGRIGPWLGEQWERLKGWFSDGAKSIQESFSRAWDGIASSVSGQWERIKFAVSAGVQAVKDFFMVTIPGWGEAFLKWTGDTLRHIGQWLNDLPGNIAYGIGFVAGWLSAAIPEQWKAFREWTAKTYEHIVQWFSELPGRLMEAVQKVGKWWDDTIVENWKGFTKWASQTATDLWNWLTGLPGRLLDAVQAMGTWLAETIPATWTAFTKWMTDTGDKLWAWLSKLPGWFTEWLTSTAVGAGKWAIKVGEAIVGGIKKGFLGIWDWLNKQLETIKSKFWEAFPKGQKAAGGGPSYSTDSGPTAPNEDLPSYSVFPKAKGGYVDRPTLILAGEGGEGEHIVPDGRVDDFLPGLLAKSKSFGRGGSVTNYFTINVSGNVTRNERDLAQMVAERLMNNLNLQKQISFS